MTKANEYVVKRIDRDKYELWRDDKHLATMTKQEAWPIILGKVHPGEFVEGQVDDAENNPDQ